MGHKLKIKCVDSRVNVHNLASTGVPFALTTVQVPNLALTHNSFKEVFRYRQWEVTKALFYGYRGFLADFFIEYTVTALQPIGRKNSILSVLVRILEIRYNRFGY